MTRGSMLTAKELAAPHLTYYLTLKQSGSVTSIILLTTHKGFLNRWTHCRTYPHYCLTQTSRYNHNSTNLYETKTTTNIGSPQAFSSPKATQSRQKRNNPTKYERSTIFNVNCRSVVVKRMELEYLSDQIALE